MPLPSSLPSRWALLFVSRTELELGSVLFCAAPPGPGSHSSVCHSGGGAIFSRSRLLFFSGPCTAASATAKVS